MENPPKKYFRLAPGREVRLRYAYFITCKDVIKDDAGNIVELRCAYDPATKGGDAPDGRKVKATLHWVSAYHSIQAEVRLYDHLFQSENPAEVDSFIDHLNPNSLNVLKDCKLESGLAASTVGFRCQFERLGYFCVDSKDSGSHCLVFNRIVTLKDTWEKIKKSD
jgi:glutaminyl-tRNA synthetase